MYSISNTVSCILFASQIHIIILAIGKEMGQVLGAGLLGASTEVSVPWAAMQGEFKWREFLEAKTLPPGFVELKDPSHIKREHCDQIIEYWRPLFAKGEQLVFFKQLPGKPKKKQTKILLHERNA